MSWLPTALPQRVEIDGLTFVPLTPALVEPDYAAVMRDIPMLRAWSGQDWPTETFPIEDNLADLERHEREQLAGDALTYSVLIDGVVQGCIYVWQLPSAFQGRPVEVPTDLVLPADDVVVRGWLHDHPAAEFIAATMAWLGPSRSHSRACGGRRTRSAPVSWRRAMNSVSRTNCRSRAPTASGCCGPPPRPDTMAAVEAFDYTQITVAHEGPVAIITLHRPDKLNAWTPRMAEEQVHAIEAANADARSEPS
jgi:hypothetical protein